MQILRNYLKALTGDVRTRKPGVITVYLKTKEGYHVTIHNIWYRNRRDLEKKMDDIESTNLDAYLNRVVRSSSIKKWYRSEFFGGRIKLFPAYDIEIIISRWSHGKSR